MFKLSKMTSNEVRALAQKVFIARMADYNIDGTGGYDITHWTNQEAGIAFSMASMFEEHDSEYVKKHNDEVDKYHEEMADAAAAEAYAESLPNDPLQDDEYKDHPLKSMYT